MSDYVEDKKNLALDYEKEHERHGRYNLIIYGYFYAGFFAIWLSFHDVWQEDVTVSSFAAILMMLSFSIFVVGEMLNLRIYTKYRGALLQNILTFDEGDVEDYAKICKEYGHYAKRHEQIFIWIFRSSTTFAVIGVVLLMYLLITSSLQNRHTVIPAKAGIQTQKITYNSENYSRHTVSPSSRPSPLKGEGAD